MRGFIVCPVHRYLLPAQPEPPYNVTVLQCYAKDVILEWQFDEKQANLTPKLSFIVEYNTSFVPNEWVFAARLPADARQAKINVSLWVTYNFRVKAINEMGVGKASAISNTECKTPQGRPDRHPRNVRTVGDKTNYLVVEWEVRRLLYHLLNCFNFRRYTLNLRMS